MSERGVFAVDRGVWDHPAFANEPFSEREAFLWLVGEAAFKARRARVASTIIDLQRGQVAHSLRFMASKWRWSEARVRRFLARLKNEAMIEACDAGATRITICNYDRYQRVSLPSDAEATQERRKVEDTKDTKDSSEPTVLRRSATTREQAQLSLPGEIIAPLIKPTAAKARASPVIQGSRLPSDWQPTPVDIQIARDEGIPDEQIPRVAAEFRDYWTDVPGQRGRKLSWAGTWRNNCRKAADRLGNTRQPFAGRDGREDRSTLGAYQRAASRYS